MGDGGLLGKEGGTAPGATRVEERQIKGLALKADGGVHRQVAQRVGPEITRVGAEADEPTYNTNTF